MKLLINEITKSQLDNLVNLPPHALILIGAKGSGKTTLSKYLSELFFSKASDINQHVASFSASDDDFGVDTISKIQKFIKVKHDGSTDINKIVIINDAQLLSHPAQNKILKTLEEPTPGSLIILTATNQNLILPTIISRCQIINIVPTNKKVTEQYFMALGFESSKINKAYRMSGGLPGLMTNLLNDDNHELNNATLLAKQILTSNNFEKLSLVETLSKDKTLFTNVTYMLQQIAHTAITESNQNQALKWRRVLSSSYKAEEMLSNNVATKLVCDQLMLSI